ncbi:MAG TPA: DHH family phosphoesterase [Opitutaceae bacterium]|nr:DHH family phosphoesterase [Opitutaceae bacterium]
MPRFFPALAPRFAQALPRLDGKRVVVIGHARPDGDCIGSQIAIARLLAARGIEALCANGDPVPRRLAYLAPEHTFYTADTLPAGDFAAVLVDCADLARVGPKLAARFPHPILNVDHHLGSNHGAEENIVDTQAAATAEIIAGMAFDLELPIDEVTAKALYAGIITDTGQFRHASTTARVFELVGRLIACGAEPVEAGYHIYERESFGRMKLLQHFLSSLRLECGGRVCVGILPLGIFEQTGTTAEDTEGLVDYARAIDGVDIGVLLEERVGMTKGSLRGKDPSLRLDRVAAQFGGGGHACAAGLNPKEPLAVVQPRLLAALAETLARVDALKSR